MWVDLSAQTQILWAFVRASPLRVADEEALLWSQSIDGLEILVRRRRFPSDVRENFAAKISDVFAHRQSAVDVHVVDAHVAGILVADTLRSLIEFFAIGVRPPIFQVAVGVELAALIVESVRQFVADRAAGVAVVWRVVHLCV